MVNFKGYKLTELLIRMFLSLIIVLLLTNSESFAISLIQDDVKITPLIQLRFSEEDSIKYLTAQVNEISSDSIGIPIEDLDIYFFVQRTFSQLPVGGDFNFTDEKGEATIEFPNDLPGDPVGNVTIIVKIDESDMFEETEVKEIVKWGIPVKFDSEEHKRSLVAAGANAPIGLIILVNIIILVVWVYIIYIITRIFKISKIS